MFFLIFIIENEWSLLKERDIILVSHHTFFVDKKNINLLLQHSPKLLEI